MKNDKNKPCGHNCYRLREYTCTACAESEIAELKAEIERLNREKRKLKYTLDISLSYTETILKALRII